MSDDIINDLRNEVGALKLKLKEAEAFQVHQLHFASSTLKKFSESAVAGSAVILEISSLGGKVVLGPVAVNGFSDETIIALGKDFQRTYNYRVDLKP